MFKLHVFNSYCSSLTICNNYADSTLSVIIIAAAAIGSFLLLLGMLKYYYQTPLYKLLQDCQLD